MRRSEIVRNLFALMLVVVGVGCVEKEPFRGDTEPIEGIIRFRFEERDPGWEPIGNPMIVLAMETETIYPCVNWIIASNPSVEGKTVWIDLLWIYKPPTCLTAMGPAMGRIGLDLPEGRYSLIFSYRGMIDSYALNITVSKIEVISEEARFTSSDSPLYWRRPPG